MDNDFSIKPHPAMVTFGFLTEEERHRMAIKLKKSMYSNNEVLQDFGWNDYL